MSSILETAPAPNRLEEPETRRRVPPLMHGDHLDQKTFHERYEAMPEHVRAELIGGVVYMTSAAKPPHGRHHGLLMFWLVSYDNATPDVESYDGTTAILADDSEPQPDGVLLLARECGGQMWENDDGYLESSPEFAGEIAHSTEAYDLHSKKRDYEKYGVKEYVVVAIRQRRVFWFVNRDGRFEEMQPDDDGILRSEVFPGLWLDPEAFLSLDGKRLGEVVQQGVESPEHAKFVEELAKRRRS